MRRFERARGAGKINQIGSILDHPHINRAALKTIKGPIAQGDICRGEHGRRNFQRAAGRDRCGIPRWNVGLDIGFKGALNFPQVPRFYIARNFL